MSAKKNDTKEKQTLTEDEIVQETAVVKAETKIPKKVDPNMAVPVRNGFHGKLVYTSKRTGERFIWDDYGDEQYIELNELRNAKGSSKGFFQNNWFMFDDAWVLDYLGVTQFYKNAVPIDSFDEIFEKSPEEIDKLISSMNDAQKRSMAYRVRTLIDEGKIDSNRVITALERSLGFDLLER